MDRSTGGGCRQDAADWIWHAAWVERTEANKGPGKQALVSLMVPILLV